MAAAILFAVFSVWINYEVKFVLPKAAGTVAALGDLKLGTLAPAFRLSDLSGATVELEAMRGDKIVLVEFWATWCPPCRMVLATLRRMEQTLQEANVEVLSVNQGEAAGSPGSGSRPGKRDGPHGRDGGRSTASGKAASARCVLCRTAPASPALTRGPGIRSSREKSTAID